ncbi:ABC-type transport auxiliary lipoprotein family protein [Sphingomonas alba]|uniref:ABC-type transport auxiliary lipoprotein family protein n=1 Tax=Sphingomonas alba TaxID=2908208 RepID=A0ABT0RMS7_9SPHN|nr:ABC-type transport auxiliary lipoprotein family protein [Sphingomonas alba]MCL6683594.1 ABC-type transport auxiliary lipoprotein family protein [Sphingomonas alba]
MRMMLRVSLAAAMAMSLGGCALLGGGPKPPPWLLTLTPSAPAPTSVVRSANAGEAVTIDVPVIPKELRSVRVPAQVGETAIAYIKDLQWVDTPDHLFQDLLQETVLRTTNRVVIDPKQSTLDPGLVVTGQLLSFGYEAGQGTVLVRYDAALSAAGGTRVETRRFEARAPADGTAATVGPALNTAANQVANDVAKWIGG